jgi:hypothetical protein
LRELGSQCSDEDLVLRALAATRDVLKRYGARVTYWFGSCDIWATMLADHQSDAIVITPRWTAWTQWLPCHCGFQLQRRGRQGV